jgi:hypothetical protein
MTNTPFEHLDKPKVEQIKDLYHSLRIVSDSLTQVRKNNYYHIGVIYTQLRALLIDKNKDKGTTPLLFLIAEYFDYPLEFYSMPSIELPGLFSISGGMPLSINKTEKNQIKTTLSDYLKTNALMIKNQNIRVETLISHLANKYGGAHYSNKVPKYLVELSNFKIGSDKFFDNYIIQLAEHCLNLGVNLLKRITDFNIYLYIYLPKNEPKTEQILIDFKHPFSNNRISIIFSQNKFHFLFTDTIGRQFITYINELILPDKLYVISLSHFLNKKFNSEFEICFNEKVFIKEIDDNPYLFVNELINYERCFNRSINKQNDDFEFGLIYYGYSGIELDQFEKLKNLKTITDLSVDSVDCFSNENFGVFGAGEKDIEIHGELKKINLSNNKKQ